MVGVERAARDCGDERTNEGEAPIRSAGEARAGLDPPAALSTPICEATVRRKDGHALAGCGKHAAAAWVLLLALLDAAEFFVRTSARSIASAEQLVRDY